MKKLLRILFIFLILWSFLHLSRYFIGLFKADTKYEEIRTESTENILIPTPSEIEPVSSYKYSDLSSDLSIDYDTIKKENADYIGWLHIPNTEISYPVMFLEGDNDFYLHRLPDGSKNFAGSIFLDGSSDGIKSENLIIYGHNMRNGSMFGRLKKWLDTDYFLSHPYIELHTKYETRFYLIFSVRKVAKTDENTYVIDGFNEDDYIENAIKENSPNYESLVRSVNLEKDEISTHTTPQLITLSTCVGDDRYRLVVNGVRVK